MPTFIKIKDDVWVNPEHITLILNEVIWLVDGKSVYLGGMSADQIMEIIKNG